MFIHIRLPRYLATDLIEDLTDHIVKNLNVSNVCMICYQLLKLTTSESLIGEVKLRTATQFSKACASDSFKQIDEDTLVAILNFNILNISELELLKACLRWTESQVVQQHLEMNRTSLRQVFEPIKHLIRFGDLSVKDFGSILKIDCFLTVEEIGSIFLHLFDPLKPIQIAYQSPRRSARAHFVKAIEGERIPENRYVSELELSIKAEKRVCLCSIETFATSRCESLSFEIRPVCRDCTIKADKQSGDRWLIDLRQLTPVLEPNASYKLRFSFTARRNNCSSFPYHPHSLVTSSDMTLKSDESGVVFKIQSVLGHHCIETIRFSGPFE